MLKNTSEWVSDQILLNYIVQKYKDELDESLTPIL